MGFGTEELDRLAEKQEEIDQLKKPSKLAEALRDSLDRRDTEYHALRSDFDQLSKERDQLNGKVEQLKESLDIALDALTRSHQALKTVKGGVESLDMEIKAAWRSEESVRRLMLLSEGNVIECEKCDGEGWLWGHELDSPYDFEYISDQHYNCDECDGECVVKKDDDEH